MVKNYGIHDTWTDLEKVNDIDIKAVDGVIDSIKVNGEEAGGGGGELSTAEINFVANSDSKYAQIEGIFIVRDEEYGDWMASNPTVTNGDILAAVLLNGTADINISKTGIADVTANGAEITSDESYYYATITTACTITITFNS